MDNLQQEFIKLQPFLPGAGYVPIHHLQQNAINRAFVLGAPHPKTPTWKYALLDEFLRQSFEPYSQPPVHPPLDLIQSYIYDKVPEPSLVFVNGYYYPVFQHKKHEKALTLKNLSSLAAKQPELLFDFLNKANQPHHFFSQLNTAFTTDGAFIIIPAGIVLKEPIVIYHFLIAEDNTPTFVSPQNHIIVEKGATVTILEKVISLSDTPQWINAQTLIQCFAGSTLHYYQLIEEKPIIYSFHHTAAQIFGGNLHYVGMQKGANYHRHSLDIQLLAPQSTAVCQGLLLPYQHQHTDWVSLLSHHAPKCTSHQKFKSVVGENGHSSFLGHILVKNEASQTIAKMTNHNLLLSENARADTSPQLEILTDDVQCNHGSAVGQLEKEALFYLESRGISPKNATQILTYAFAEEILQAIENESIKQDFLRHLKSQLGAFGEAQHE